MSLIIRDRWIFGTKLKPTGAGRLFPCWDEPSKKARFTIAILHHEKYNALSNMPIMHRGDLYRSDYTETHFGNTPPIPVYLVAIWLTNLNCYVKKLDIKIHVCHKLFIKEQITLALDITSKVMVYLDYEMETLFSQYTVIIIPDLPYDVSENWALIIYRYMVSYNHMYYEMYILIFISW